MLGVDYITYLGLPFTDEVLHKSGLMFSPFLAEGAEHALGNDAGFLLSGPGTVRGVAHQFQEICEDGLNVALVATCIEAERAFSQDH